MGLLTRIMQSRASLENPTTTLDNADEWLIDWAGGGESSAGIAVNSESAFKLAAVWRAVSLISGDVAKLPLHIYRRLSNGGKERDTSHTAYKLLRRRPNEHMNDFAWKRSVLREALILGNSYSYIWRYGDGRPAAITPLPPFPDTYPVTENGRLYYVTKIDGKLRKLFPENVFHIKGPGNGYEGHSVIGHAKDSLGEGLAAQTYSCTYFKNGAHPGVVLEHPTKLTPEGKKTLLESWERMHKGLDNSHRTAVLVEGTKAHTLSIPMKDQQFLESRQFKLVDIANWFGLPPHKLGDSSRTAYNSLEQENQAYLNECLDTWLVNFESECWSKLLTKPQQDRDTHVVEFVRAALLRADMATRYQSYAIGITNGILNRNEVRERENLNPYEGGDEFLTPLNMSGGDQDDDTEPEPDTSEPPEPDNEPAEPQQNAIRTVVEDACERMVTRLRVHADKARRQNRLQQWLDSGIEEHRGVITEALGPAVGLTSRDVTSTVDRLLQLYRDDAENIPATIADEVIK